MRDRLSKLMNFSLVAMLLIGILPMANFADEQIDQLQENTIDELVSPNSLENESENEKSDELENEKSDELEETLDENKPDTNEVIQGRSLTGNATNFNTDFTEKKALIADNGTMNFQQTDPASLVSAKGSTGGPGSWWDYFVNLPAGKSGLVSARSTRPIQGINNGWTFSTIYRSNGLSSSDGIAWGISTQTGYTPVSGNSTLGFYQNNGQQTPFTGFVIEMDNKYDGASVEGFSQNVGRHLAISYVRNGQVVPGTVNYVSINDLDTDGNIDGKVTVSYVPAANSPTGRNQLYASYQEFITNSVNKYYPPRSVVVSSNEVDGLLRGNQYLYINTTRTNDGPGDHQLSLIVGKNKPLFGDIETSITTTIKDGNGINIIDPNVGVNAGDTVTVEHEIGNADQLPFVFDASLSLDSLFNDTNNNQPLVGNNVMIDGQSVPGITSFSTSSTLPVKVKHEANKTKVTYKVSIPTSSPTTTTSVNVNLTGPHLLRNSSFAPLNVRNIGPQYEITAQNGIIDSVESANQVLPNDYVLTKLYLKASAYKKSNPGEEGTVQVVHKPQNITQAGVYNITLGVQQEPSTQITVKLIVMDTQHNKDGIYYAVGANDFSVDSILEANNLLQNDNDLIIKADAKAFNKINSNRVPVVVSNKPSNITSPGVYDVTFAVRDEPTTDVTVKMLVKDENTICDGQNNVCLVAKNFSVGLTEILSGSVNDAKVKQLAQVKGFDKEGNDLTADVQLDATDLANINSHTQAGVVNDVTFTLEKDINNQSIRVTKDVTATIVDDVQYTIDAQHFAVNVNDARSLTADSVKGANYANVSLSPVGNVADVQVDGAQLAMIKNGVVGKYPLTFTYNTVTKTINVTVYDDNTTFEPGKPGNESGIFLTSDTKIELGVNKDAQALGLTSVATFNHDVVSATNAKSWLKDGTDATVTVVENPVVDQPGSYVVKLKGTNNAGLETDIREVIVIVKDINTICNGNVCLTAQNFNVSLAEIAAGTVDEAKVKQLAQVKGFDDQGNDRTADVRLDAADLAKITSQTQAGVINDVTFTLETATKDVTATILDDVQYTINAQHFAVKDDVARNLTADSVKGANYANVSLSPVGNVNDVQVDGGQLAMITNGVVGKYPLTFTYNGATKTINVTVYDDNTAVEPGKPGDESEIFLTADSQVKLRTNNSKNNKTLRTVAEFNQDIPAATNAKSWYRDGTPANVLVAPGSQPVLDQPGLYIVKLVGAGNGYETTHKEVYVTVVDDNTDCNDEVCITAQPIDILLSEASIYNEAMAKDRAQPIKAWYVNRPDAITQDQIKADASDIAIVNKQTTGTVLTNGQKFYVEGAQPLTTGVDVRITEDPVGSFAITGQNLKYHEDDAKVLTEDQIKADGIVTITNANGVDVTSAMLDKVVVDQTQFAQITSGKLGTHDLKFTLNGSETTIKVTVYNDGTTTDVPGDPDKSKVFLNTDKYIELGTNSAAAQLGLPSVDEFNGDIEGKLNIVATHSDGLGVTVTINPNTVPNTAGSYKLSVSATATDGKTAGPVEVVVLVKDENTICNGDVCLTAQNFNVSLAEIAAGTVDESKVKQLAQVKGFDKQGNDRTADVQLDAADLAKITSQTQAGVVNDVTFTLETATKDVTATILDDVQYTINAQHFAVSVDVARNLTADSVKGSNYANVSLSPVGDVDNVQVNAGELSVIQNGVVGKYPLTFTYNGATKTINVTVYDDNTTVEPGKPGNESGIFLTSDTKVELGVNKDAQVLGLTSVDTFNQDVVSATNAKSWLRDGTDATVRVVENPVVDQPGRYVVKLKGTNNAGLETDVREVTVIVKDINTNCNGEVCISAQPIEILLSEASIYDEAMAKDRAKPIKAWYVDKADVITQDQIKADARDIAIVNGQTTATVLTNGQKFQVEGAQALTTGVDVTITEDVVGSFRINASNNIVLSSDEAKIATSEQLRDKAGITITNANGVDVTAAMIDEVVANATQLTAINTGVAQAYPLKFELNGSQSNEIQVSVYDDNTATDKPNDKPNSELFLNADSPIELRTNNSTKYNTLPSVDEFNQDVLGLTNANAYHKDPNVNVTISPATANIADKAGRYTLTLTATATDGKTATKEIVIIVKDDNTSCNDKVCIVASDFAQNLTEVAQLTEDEAKVKANVNAFYIDQAGAPTVSVNQTQLGAIQGLTQMPNTNPMDLTFSAEGLDAPVKVTIVDNNYTLSANDFNVNASDLPLDEAGVVNKANATATNNSTQTPGTVKVDQSSLNTLNATTEGVVDVTLYVDEQPTVRDTIKVNVVPEGAVVGDKATIAADSPIEINLSDVLKGDKDKLFDIIKNKANARAWYNDGTKPDPTIIYDENQMNNILAQKAPVNDLDFTFIVDGDNKAKKPIKVNIVDDTQIILPGQDGNLGTNDDVHVKPNPDQNGNYPTIKPDGSVDLPNGGEVTIPGTGNDDVIVTPPGSNIKPDGTITTPGGNEVMPEPEGGVELPGDDGKLPAPDHVDNPLVKPDGDGPIVVNPDGSVTLPSDEEGTITYPNNPGNNGTVNIPGGSTVSPDGIVTPPNGGSPVDTDEDGSLKVPGPNEQLGDADDVVVKPGGNGDATITPEGGIELPNGGTIVPDDGNGKEWSVNPGTVVNPNGSITLPGNNPQISFDPTIRPNGDGSITVPGKDGVFDENGDNDHRVDGPGITFDPDNGNVSLPNGGTVTKPGGQQVTVPNGTIVLPDGTIIIPATGINQVPVITINSSPSYTYDQATETITINQNTPFDAATIATATDAEDGDITKDLVINVTRTKQIVNGSVDTSIAPSEWNIDYSVTDSQGASARKTVKVIVVQTATAPVINGVRDQEVTVGEDIDLMAGVTAEDYQGNDLTNQIVISVTDPNGKVSTDINTMIIGDHKVTYTVTDANGLTTSETCTVTVKPIILPGQDNIPGTDDDVIVTPNPDGNKPEFKPDGSVELPGGGDVEFPGGGGVVVPPGSTVTPGGDVVTPDNNVPVRPQPPTNEKPNGSVELPGNDGELGDPNNPNDPDREDNPVITPEGPNKPVIKPDGGVELPDGGDIEYPFSPENPGGSIVVPPGSVVNPDGSVETPEGGKVDTDEDGTITLPGQDDQLGTDDDVAVKPGGNGDATINPDGSVTVPGGGEITFPNKPDHNGTITIPGDSTVKPDGTVVTPDGDVVRPNPDGTIQLPGQDDQLGTDDDVIVKPGGNGDATIKPDGSVDLPNGGDVSFPNKPDAGMEVPGESNVGQDGTVTAPNGDQSRPNVDGTITVPGHDGQFGTEDDGIIKPNGPNKPVLNPDGTITLPDGGDITFPGLGDCEIEILPGGHVASTGVVTNPGADGIINTADDEVLDPAVVCAIEPTVTPEQTKPEATHTGSASNMMMLFVTIAISSAVVLGLRRRK